jgi:hypothetical protein
LLRCGEESNANHPVYPNHSHRYRGSGASLSDLENEMSDTLWGYTFILLPLVIAFIYLTITDKKEGEDEHN